MNMTHETAQWMGKVKTAALTWVESKVDEVCPNVVVRRNIKRFVSNWMETKEHEVNKWLDKVKLIGLDKEGNIDNDLIVDEVCAMCKEIDYSTDIFNCEFNVKDGRATLMLPDNMLMNILFGNKASVSMDVEELKEIKQLMV